MPTLMSTTLLALGRMVDDLCIEASRSYSRKLMSCVVAELILIMVHDEALLGTLCRGRVSL